MNLPQEIELWYVIPALRRELCKALKQKNLSQNKISKLLGITPAAISQYLNSKRGHKINFPVHIKREIKKSAENIINGQSEAFREIHFLCELIKQERILCAIHRAHGHVMDNCDLCFKKRYER